MPVQNVIDYFEGGDSISDFLEDFPTVTRERVISFLEEAKDLVRPLQCLSEDRSEIFLKIVTVSRPDRSHQLDGSTCPKNDTAHKVGAAFRHRRVVHSNRGVRA